MTEGFTTITMEPRKHIALVAHDNRKQDLIEWAMEHKEELARHALCGTGTTAALVARHTGLDVTPYRRASGGFCNVIHGIVRSYGIKTVQTSSCYPALPRFP